MHGDLLLLGLTTTLLLELATGLVVRAEAVADGLSGRGASQSFFDGVPAAAGGILLDESGVGGLLVDLLDQFGEQERLASLVARRVVISDRMNDFTESLVSGKLLDLLAAANHKVKFAGLERFGEDAFETVGNRSSWSWSFGGGCHVERILRRKKIVFYGFPW